MKCTNKHTDIDEIIVCIKSAFQNLSKVATNINDKDANEFGMSIIKLIKLLKQKILDVNDPKWQNIRKRCRNKPRAIICCLREIRNEIATNNLDGYL